jgi:hypothetical protein
MSDQAARAAQRIMAGIVPPAENPAARNPPE